MKGAVPKTDQKHTGGGVAWGHLDSDVLFELFPMFLCERQSEGGGGDRQTDRKRELVVTAQSAMTVTFILVQQQQQQQQHTEMCVFTTPD